MSRKKTNKIEAETGEVVQSNRPFIIRNGGIAKPLGQGLYLLGGKTHEQGGIDIDFTGDARIFSAQPILNGNSPAELVARGANPNQTFNRQERFKDVNGINDDGTRKAKYGKDSAIKTETDKEVSKLNRAVYSSFDPTELQYPRYMPLNMLKDYTIQYMPTENSMKYRDTYNFDNGDMNFEPFVPGTPYRINGSIDLTKNNMKSNNKKKLGGSTGLIRVQANGKDRLMYVPFTGEETKAGRKKALLGTELSQDERNRLNEWYAQQGVPEYDRVFDKDRYHIAFSNNNQQVGDVWHISGSQGASSPEGTNVAAEIAKMYLPTISNSSVSSSVNKPTIGKENLTYTWDVNGKKLTSTADKPKISTYPPKLNTNELPTKITLSPGVKSQIEDAVEQTYKNSLSWWDKNKKYAAPAISALGNIGAGIASYAINKRMLGDLDYSPTPIAKRAAKLKTNININPELTALNENLSRTIESTNANTTSSRVANARNQAAMLNTTLTANKLYTDKENRETALINQDRLNQQEVANTNIDAYNTWRAGKTNFENTVREQMSENAVSLVDNINKGIQTGITDAEKRRQFRNNLAVMAAAYPNVTPKLLRSYGVDFLRMGGKVKLNKKK